MYMMKPEEEENKLCRDSNMSQEAKVWVLAEQA